MWWIFAAGGALLGWTLYKEEKGRHAKQVEMQAKAAPVPASSVTAGPPTKQDTDTSQAENVSIKA